MNDFLQVMFFIVGFYAVYTWWSSLEPLTANIVFWLFIVIIWLYDKLI